jgi:hypothetical protein
MLGVHWLAKVWIEVMIDSTAPYRFRALWLMMLSRNSTIRIGPSQPVDCLTAHRLGAFRRRQHRHRTKAERQDRAQRRPR